MVYRQINEFDAADPEAVQDVPGVVATINGMALEGKVGSRGLPKNPLQFAATRRTPVGREGSMRRSPSRSSAPRRPPWAVRPTPWATRASTSTTSRPRPMSLPTDDDAALSRSRQAA